MLWDVTCYILLVALLITGLFVNLLGLPGLWLMLASAAGYAWATGWNRHVGWQSLAVLLVLAVVAEVVEFVAGSAGAKKAGGSKRGMIGAVIGGLLGGFFLTFIPVPIISTIVGVCLGTFLGAWTVELLVGKEMGHSMQIGVGAAKGRLLGTMLKTLFGVAILIVGDGHRVPHRRGASRPESYRPRPRPPPLRRPSNATPLPRRLPAVSCRS